MDNLEIKKQYDELLSKHERLSYILGISTGMLIALEPLVKNKYQKENIKWIDEAIENVIYKNKPLPKLPRRN